MSGGGGGGGDLVKAVVNPVGAAVEAGAGLLGIGGKPAAPTAAQAPVFPGQQREAGVSRAPDTEELRRRLIASGRSRSLVTGAAGAPGAAQVGKRKLLGE